MRRLFFIIALLVCGILSRCGTDKSNDSKEQETLDESETGANLKGWDCFEIGDDDLCCPSNWRPIKQTDYYYFSNLDSTKDNTSFLILRYRVDSTGLTPRIYLKEGYSQMLRDSVSKFTGYTVKKLIFQDNDAYYSEFFSEQSNKKYLTYSMMFEKGNYLYDFCLKVEKSKSPKYKDTLRNILLTFKVKGEQVFNYKDEMEKIEIVDLSKL